MKIFNVLKLFLISFLFSYNAFSMQARALHDCYLEKLNYFDTDSDTDSSSVSSSTETDDESVLVSEYKMPYEGFETREKESESDNEIEETVAFFPSEKEVQDLKKLVSDDLQRDSRLVFTAHLKTQILLTTFITMGVELDIESTYCFENSFKDKKKYRLLVYPRERVLFLCSDIDRIIENANRNDDMEIIKYFKVLQDSFQDLFDASSILDYLTYNEDFLKMSFPNINNFEELRYCSYTLLSSNVVCLFNLFDLVKDYSIKGFEKRKKKNLKLATGLKKVMNLPCNLEMIYKVVDHISENREAMFLNIYDFVYRYVYKNL